MTLRQFHILYLKVYQNCSYSPEVLMTATATTYIFSKLKSQHFKKVCYLKEVFLSRTFFFEQQTTLLKNPKKMKNKQSKLIQHIRHTRISTQKNLMMEIICTRICIIGKSNKNTQNRHPDRHPTNS